MCIPLIRYFFYIFSQRYGIRYLVMFLTFSETKLFYMVIEICSTFAFGNVFDFYAHFFRILQCLYWQFKYLNIVQFLYNIFVKITYMQCSLIMLCNIENRFKQVAGKIYLYKKYLFYLFLI